MTPTQSSSLFTECDFETHSARSTEFSFVHLSGCHALTDIK